MLAEQAIACESPRMKSSKPAKLICRRLVCSLITVGALFVAGCQTKTTTQQAEGVFPSKSAAPTKYYVHCETCNWCKGPFKRMQDAKQTASEHNIKLHDYRRLAYFDTEKCSR